MSIKYRLAPQIVPGISLVASGELAPSRFVEEVGVEVIGGLLETRLTGEEITIGVDLSAPLTALGITELSLSWYKSFDLPNVNFSAVKKITEASTLAIISKAVFWISVLRHYPKFLLITAQLQSNVKEPKISQDSKAE